jgi:internalin A
VIARWRVIALHADAMDFAPLAEDETSVRVTDTLTHAQYEAIAAVLRDRPDAALWIDDRSPDLEMLCFFPGLRRLRVTSLRKTSWDGLRHVADTLDDLGLSDTLRPLSIAPLVHLRRLTVLGLHGPVRHVETLASLDGLEELSLRSVTLPDLSLLLPMRRLRSLYLGLGGTADLSLLADLPALEELELWRIRGMRDVSPIGAAVHLRELRLQSMSAVTELPSLRDLSRLRLIALDTMKGITDMRPVADAPALEELLLVAMCHLEPMALRPLVGHPSLRKGIWGLCSDRKNAEAWELVPLGDPPWNYERWKARQAKRATGKRP